MLKSSPCGTTGVGTGTGFFFFEGEYTGIWLVRLLLPDKESRLLGRPVEPGVEYVREWNEGVAWADPVERAESVEKSERSRDARFARNVEGEFLEGVPGMGEGVRNLGEEALACRNELRLLACPGDGDGDRRGG